MIITDEAVRKVRRYLNEVIPADGQASDTGFSEQDIADLLTDSSNIYAAAAQGWRLKAATASQQPGELKKYTIGQETYERTTGSDYAAYCLDMAKMYDDMAAKADNTASSRVLSLRRPRVI
ncbi:hypothetical protein [Selenomonas ruminantium]|uniref:Uncharacterized protein n=1 Tax=Selenomonas ruminantium TaxID=971 RepID=A0A1H0N189_SELRU|nr:hypothetical protein [Selenomonas ruminantium]SDO86427.1 hypothetical protein SAMN05216366_102129 [Selenomonas ruminantium]